MKIKLNAIILITLLASLLLAGCQAQPSGIEPVAAQDLATPTAIEMTPTQKTGGASVPTATPAAGQVTGQSQADPAEEAAAAYFTALAQGETEGAAELLSSFSLMVFQMTRGEAASALLAEKLSGVRWSDFNILGSQALDDQTVLIHVTYTETQLDMSPTASPAPTATATKTASPAASPTVAIAAPTKAAGAEPTLPPAAATAPPETQKDELWPMRLENSEWRYNWDNLIDFRTLDAGAQTVSGVTVMPVQMNRYSDRIELSLLVQNRTNEGVVFGQVNETLGTFYFDGQPVVAEKTRWILNPNRSVPSVTLEAKGLFTEFPEMVEIRKWNSYQVDPWYVFQLQ